MSAPPPGSMLQPHSGLISHHTGARAPASPMPSMFAQEEPVRHNRQQPEQSPQPDAAESARVIAGMLAPSPGGLLLSSPDVVHRGSFSSYNSSGNLSSFNGEQRKKFKIYHCLEMATVARELVSLDDRFVLAEVQWDHFPDGFPNLFIQGADSVKNYHCCFLANFHDPSVFFEQFSVITALPKLLPKSFKLFLPFFPTGTMERVSRLGEVATANTLARLLSTIPNCSKGPAQICIFDIHALQNQFYFKDTVLIRLGTCVNLLLDRIAALPDRENVNIAFPDDGAAKRFGDMFAAAYPHLVICHKVRGEGDKRVVKLKEGLVAGKHCIIVDDLVQSGSTMLECAKELLRNGASCVSAYVTHAIFPKQSYRKFFKDECAQGEKRDTFKHFFVTDSNPSVADQLRGKDPFEVLSVAKNIREIILDEEKQG